MVLESPHRSLYRHTVGSKWCSWMVVSLRLLQPSFSERTKWDVLHTTARAKHPTHSCVLRNDNRWGWLHLFLPRSLTRTSSASRIVRALFRDRYNVLLKLKKKSDSEAYTLIQPHPHFPNTGFGVLVNSFHGYTRPLNAFMKEYILLGIIPAYAARRRSIQGFKSNGHKIQFRNCDANPNSYFAFMPNHNRQTPSNYGASWHIFETSRVAVDWRSKAISIPVRTMPNEFFFLTELHFGGCGTYTSSNRWRKFGFHFTAIGIR